MVGRTQMCAIHRHSLRVALGLAMFLTSCVNTPQPISLSFKLRLNGRPFDCNTPAALSDGTMLTLSTLKVFIHDIRLLDSNGNETPFVLSEDGRWQHQGVALLDFENGQGTCKNGSPEMHTTLTGAASGAHFSALAFRLGVPFSLNHLNPAQAPSPLSDTTMHWDWQGGYKFFRLESRSGMVFHRLHLGSTGCDGTIGNISGCSRPNRAEVLLKNFDSSTASITLDIGPLVNPIPGGVEASTCMGGMDEPGCASFFKSLGLDLNSGKPMASAEVFQTP